MNNQHLPPPLERMESSREALIDARFFVWLLITAVFVGAACVRAIRADDRAAYAERKVAEMESRLAEAEAFVEFARPLWPGVE